MSKTPPEVTLLPKFQHLYIRQVQTQIIWLVIQNEHFYNIFSSFSSSKWGLCRLDQPGHPFCTPPYSMNSTGNCFDPFSQVKLHLCLPTKRSVRVSLFHTILVDGAPAQCSLLQIGKFACALFLTPWKGDPQKCDQITNRLDP